MLELFTTQETVNDFRHDIPLNMINLRCSEFNKAIWDRIEYLKMLITDHVLKNITIHNER